MKLLAASTVAGLAFLIPSSAGLQPGIARIRVTGTLISQHDATKIYALYNQPAYTERLGTGFAKCEQVSVEFSDCESSWRFGRGQIIARAVVPSVSSFRVLAVTGGTGYYSNVGGQALLVTISPTSILLIIDLEAF